MKKRITFLIVAFLFLCRISFGDIIMDNVHYVEKCVKITNLADYPDVAFLGFVPRSARSSDTYLISSSQCLTKGYKYNDFNVFAVNKTYLEGKDLKKIDLPSDSNAISSNVYLEILGYYVHDSIRISGVEQYYQVIGFSNTSVVLHKWKEVTKYNNRTPDLIKTFAYEGDVSKLSQKLPVGANYPAKQNIIEVYPNPTDKNVHFRIRSSYMGPVPLEIVTMGGEVVKSSSIYKAGIIVDYDVPVAHIAKGTYLVNVKFGNTVESQKIVIQ